MDGAAFVRPIRSLAESSLEASADERLTIHLERGSSNQCGYLLRHVMQGRDGFTNGPAKTVAIIVTWRSGLTVDGGIGSKIAPRTSRIQNPPIPRAGDDGCVLVMAVYMSSDHRLQFAGLCGKVGVIEMVGTLVAVCADRPW